jgi:hypothetical protein
MDPKKRPATMSPSRGGDLQDLRDQVAILQATVEKILETQPTSASIEEQLQRQLGGFKANIEALIASYVTAALEPLMGKIKDLEDKLEAFDRAGRAGNLILKNKAEPIGETPQSLFATVQGLLQVTPGRPAPTLVEVRRLGKPVTDRPRPHPRPVFIKFASVTAKHAALSVSKVLRARQLYLDVDLTRAQKDSRWAQRDRYRFLREHGMRPYWREDRIYVVNYGRAEEDTGGQARQDTADRGVVGARTASAGGRPAGTFTGGRPGASVPPPPPRPPTNTGGPTAMDFTTTSDQSTPPTNPSATTAPSTSADPFSST